MTLVRRLFGSLISAFVCVLALAGQAAPVDAHTVSHWITPVASGEHHHHAHDGDVVADHEHSEENIGGEDGGHQHVAEAPSFAITPPIVAPHAPRPTSRTMKLARSDPPAPDLSASPQHRPPRFA